MPTTQNSPDNVVQYRAFLVAVLDILGQREAIRRLAKVEPSEASRTQLIEALKQSLGVRDEVQESIIDGFRRFVNYPNSVDNAHLSDEQRELRGSFEQCQIKAYGFGDTVVAYAPLMNGHNHPSVKDVYGLLAGCAGIIMGALGTETPIRGAVELGYGVEPNAHEVYGPAFLSAYELEQHVAQYPRIVVGSELVQYLHGLLGQSGSSMRETLIREVAKACWSFIARDEDGCFFVDFLGEGFRRLSRDKGDLKMVNNALAFVEREYRRFVNNADQKLAGRYGALLRYFRASVPAWQSAGTRPAK